MATRLRLARNIFHTTRCFSTVSCSEPTEKSYKFVVCGGGAGGLAVGSSLASEFGSGSVAIIEPSEVHYYQPLWTLVGGGIKPLEDSARPMRAVIPDKATWVKSKVAEFCPKDNYVVTDGGCKLNYEYLIVGLGLDLRWDMVKGLKEALGTPGVGSNYSSDTVLDTWTALKGFDGGNAIFTLPNTPIKCLGAPQKIMYIAEDYMRRMGIRFNSTVMFNSALGTIFGVKKYANALLRIVNARDIKLNFRHNLIEIRPDTKEAVFEILNELQQPTGDTETFSYSFIHVTPPMGAAAVLRNSPLADEKGFLDVNQFTMQSKRFSNVFGLGDCTNSPNGKTAAAVAGQAGVLKSNLAALMKGKNMPAQYDGYTSCPLVTGYGKLILAEFDFNGEPLETFPVDQSKERRTMYHLKRDVLPEVYWNGLIKGLWNGTTTLRRTMHANFKP